jgi:hypothetical protein
MGKSCYFFLTFFPFGECRHACILEYCVFSPFSFVFTCRNHFEQTYTSQVHLILEPVFARLGVRHESRNLANGGMGTIQHGLGGGSFYGPDVSFLMWDSGKSSQNIESGIRCGTILFLQNSRLEVHHQLKLVGSPHSRGIYRNDGRRQQA